METMYFVLGMLSIIGAIAIALIVWGVLKITKLLKAIRQQEEWIMNNDRNVWDGTQRLREDLERRQDNMERHVYQNVTELQREMDMKINDQITDAVTESHSYTDKRIDRLIDTYLGDKKTKEK
jgi:ABC-type siderophore export system fused ATPase/permease subunit